MSDLQNPYSQPRLRPVHLGLMFAAVYWTFEAIRDVLVFNKGSILERLFLPDLLSLVMRLLAVCILVAFGAYADFLYGKIRSAKDVPAGMMPQMNLVWPSLGFVLLYWVIESLRDSFAFGKGNFWIRLAAPDSTSLWMRLLSVFVIILLGLYVQNLIRERLNQSVDIQQIKRRLEETVERRTADLSILNRKMQEEIASHKRDNERYQKTIRALNVLCNINEISVKAADGQKLLEQACQILAEGGYAMAWAGEPRPEAKGRVKVIARAARNPGDLDFLSVEPDDYEVEKWPVGRALFSEQNIHIPNFLQTTQTTNWTNLAMKRKFQSVFCMPLKKRQSLFCVLSLFTESGDFLSEDELDYLKKTARRLSDTLSRMDGG
jgi:hypothetical protein